MNTAGSPSRLLVQITRAGVKKLGAVIRGIGMLREHPDWQARAEACSRCPLSVIEDRTAYCGRPYLKKIDRDEATEGCGCPIFDKAKDPSEHCPRTRHFEASTKGKDCDCNWCVTLRSKQQAANELKQAA